MWNVCRVLAFSITYSSNSIRSEWIKISELRVVNENSGISQDADALRK